MGKKKSLWLECLTNSFAFMLGAVLTAAFSLNWSQKPSSREIEASQKKPTTMTVTAYTQTGMKASTMITPKPGIHAAVSRDRLDLLGKRVYIKCDDVTVGIRDIVDLGGSSMSNTVDILMPTFEGASDFGRKDNCEAIVVGQVK